MTTHTTDRAAITAAFAALRKQGFLARQSYLCCGGCAVADLDTEANQGKRYVFYHRQAADAFIVKLAGRNVRTDDLYRSLFLGWGKVGDQVDECEALAIGRAICAALEAEGLTVAWDGRLADCIEVLSAADQAAQAQAAEVDEQERLAALGGA